jgi:hypothetical protein
MAIKLSLAHVEIARETLEALPAAARETRQVRLREAVKLLSPTIRKLLRKGYSRSKVVELLAEHGVKVSVSTFKQYFREKAVPVGEQSADRVQTTAARS